MYFATIQDCNAPYTNPWPLFTAKILPWPNYPKPGKSLQWTCDLIPSKTHPPLNKQTKLYCLFGVRVIILVFVILTDSGCEILVQLFSL